MHTLVRRFIKTAIGFLAAGLLIGAWMIARRELLGQFPTRYEVSAHVHALQVGFVMNMILGVALWLFPRPDKEDTRYSPRAIEWSFWLLALGTGGRVAGELLRHASEGPALRWGIVLCGLAQAAGLLLYFHTMWTRIRPLGSKIREAAGERF